MGLYRMCPAIGLYRPRMSRYEQVSSHSNPHNPHLIRADTHPSASHPSWLG
eukprot:COSAG01_NODE_68780_length_263_cov_0.628049_1_plen_50_part_01